MSPMDEPSIQRGTLMVYNTLDELARAWRGRLRARGGRGASSR